MKSQMTYICSLPHHADRGEGLANCHFTDAVLVAGGSDSGPDSLFVLAVTFSHFLFDRPDLLLRYISLPAVFQPFVSPPPLPTTLHQIRHVYSPCCYDLSRSTDSFD